MSPFEIAMLVCFGASWPFSIRKTLVRRSAEGKSLLFLSLVLIGYGCGIVHKFAYHFDGVIWCYAFNALLVAVDLALCVRYRGGERNLPSAS